MSLTLSSKGFTTVVLVAILLTATGTAAAISADAERVPTEAEVGSEVTAEIVVEDPFTDQDEWTLAGATNLTDVGWTVTVLDQGQRVSQETYGEGTFEQSLQRSNGGDEVAVEVTGTVPEITNYSYDPEDSVPVIALASVTGNNPNELGVWSTHHYTEDSDEARQAIDDAGDTIEDAGGNDEAESLRQNAISAYEAGNFDNAVDLASDAEDAATQAQQSQQTMQLALYGVGALVVLALIGGGIYYWRSQQGPQNRLQ